VKIGILGGGPAGLYFALLMKKQDAARQITVVEQNPAGATYGWGVVFSDRALSYLAASDADSYRDITATLQTWDDQAIVHRGQQVRIDGLGFSGIARLDLLRILQEHCRRHGVRLELETRVTDLTAFRGHDLIVGADGVNSVVRETHRAEFGSTVEVLSNKYLWYGTPQLFDTLRRDDRVFLALRAEPGGGLQRHRIRRWRHHRGDQRRRAGMRGRQPRRQRFNCRAGSCQSFRNHSQRHDCLPFCRVSPNIAPSPTRGLISWTYVGVSLSDNKIPRPGGSRTNR